MRKELFFMASCLLVAGCHVAPENEYSDENLRLFREGIRVEAVDGEAPAMYVLFTPDSLKAELYTAGKEGKEVLEQRTLPTGEHVWNVEDDDTKNLRYTDGCWTISQRGKLRFQQSPSVNNGSLGAWNEVHYEGVLPAADCPGIRYQVYVRHREHSGDGHFLLRLTYLEAEQGKDMSYTYTGRRYTLRGTAADNDATVWRLVVDGDKNHAYNLLYGPDGETLTYLNNNFEEIQSGLNYTLRRVD